MSLNYITCYNIVHYDNLSVMHHKIIMSDYYILMLTYDAATL